MYKLYKFRENRARDMPLWGVYSRPFGQISVKFACSFVVLYPYRCTDGSEIWHGAVDLRSTPPCQISSSSMERVAPERRKTKIALLSNLYSGALALRCAQCCNRADHYMFALLFLSFFFLFSSPNLSGRRSDVYHTSTHGVVLVRI